MSERWAVVSKPDATLTPIDPEPMPRYDGATWQRFSTSNGVQFAKVVYPWGQTTWMQLVTQ